MEDDYLANKSQNITKEAMALKAKKHHSIKGPCLVPIPSIMNVVPSGLHISLMVGLALIKLLESWCDILDEEEDISRLADLVEDIFSEVSEGSGEQEEEDNTTAAGGGGEEEQAEVVTEEILGSEGVEESMGGGEADVTDSGPRQVVGGVGQGTDGAGQAASHNNRREEKERAQEDLVRAEQVVGEEELKVTEVVKEVRERKELLQRIVLNKNRDYVGVEELAKAKFKVKSVQRRYKYCSMTYCVLSHFDRQVTTACCDSCGRHCHVDCELWNLGIPEVDAHLDPAQTPDLDTTDQEEIEPQVCSTCRPAGRNFESYEDMERLVEPVVGQARDKLVLAQGVLEKARAEEGRCRKVLAAWVGEHRRQLMDILENTLKVTKTAYQGGTYVGNHVQSILNGSRSSLCVWLIVPRSRGCSRSSVVTTWLSTSFSRLPGGSHLWR